MLKRLTQSEPAPPWSYLSALGAIVIMFLTVIIGTTISQVVLGEEPSDVLTGWIIGMMLTTAFVMISRHSRSVQDAQALRLSVAPQTKLPIIFLWALGFAVTLDLLSWVITNDRTLAAAELINFSQGTITITGWIIAFIFMVIAQPIAEELVFRGMVFPALRTAAGPWPGLLLCAGLYAAFHMLAYAPNAEDQTVIVWYGFVLPFLTAVIITSIRAATGSTHAAIIAHAAFGLFALLKVITYAG